MKHKFKVGDIIVSNANTGGSCIITHAETSDEPFHWDYYTITLDTDRTINIGMEYLESTFKLCPKYEAIRKFKNDFEEILND